MPFTDHFSGVAADYAAFRPKYPAALIERLAALAPRRAAAWDVATGSGQAAILLAERFDRVIATDASAQQIASAVRHERIEYRVAAAEESGLPTASIDLIAVAQALHWFDVERFHAEARRVAAKGAVIAEWCYGIVRAADAEVDRVVRRFYSERIGRWWPAERSHVETGYRDLPFPFEPIDVGEWSIVAPLDRARLVGYARTWSAVKECRAHEGVDPIPEFDADLARAWPAGSDAVEIRWPITIRVGRVALAIARDGDSGTDHGRADPSPRRGLP